VLPPHPLMAATASACEIVRFSLLLQRHVLLRVILLKLQLGLFVAFFSDFCIRGSSPYFTSAPISLSIFSPIVLQILKKLIETASYNS
jgi:hypothetical protein